METVHTLRIEHGNVQNANMSYSRQPQNHRPNHAQQTRSPISNASRYAYPASPQLQPAPSQRYAVGGVPLSYRPPRLSLLHSSEYAPPRTREIHPSPHHHLDQGQQPFKKIRLQDNNKDIQPLRIDTREQQGAYNPQVEAISPTLPDHVQQEDQAFRTTKDDLLQQISKVDREIAKAESQISILKKKQQELEEVASKPTVKKEEEEDNQPKHQSLAQKIYAENRKRAQNAHGKLDSLGGKVDWPIYNQPSDTTVYQENKRKNVSFKKCLLEYFKKRHVEKESRNAYLTETYSKLMQEWLRKVDKIEGSTKRKAKEAKNREFFEKVFPELRKQREDKERFNRVGARIKSEADMEEIMDNLQEQALEDKKMRSYAVIPPILLDAKERKLTYQNNNGYIVDMEKAAQFMKVWTSTEKQIFTEKYLQHPKNFGVIASYLERKSVSDCVQYYYLSKKTENYKQLLRKSRQRTRSSRNNPQKVSTANTTDHLTSGVTTRLQREQQQKTVGQRSQPQDTTTTTTTTTSVANTTTPAITTTTTAASTTTASSTTVVTTTSTSTVTNVCTAKSPENQENKPNADNNTQNAEKKTEEKPDNNGAADNNSSNNDQNAQKKDGVETVTDNQSSDQTASSVVENKKKKERRKDKENSAMETTDDESTDVQDKSAQGQCIVCGSQLGPQLQSRPLAPSQASQYGLQEDQVPPNGRVCNTCRCKCVRSRFTHCPLPACPNARGRVKRLRSFPQRLQDLPQEVRDPILAEFHIPSGVTKCCSACFNRIQRRLGPVEEWAEEEVVVLRSALTELGANWAAIGERINKPAHVVRSYYAANRKRLNLESCLGDRKPTLTDEEESGSSTSSCEEPMRERHSSDTASAESPPVIPEQPQNPIKKEDYDSSATETADEGQTPDLYQSATITPVNPDGQPRQNTSPLTVKDLMLNVIEISLKKTPGGQQNTYPPTSVTAPTISSILNSSDSNEVTIVSEYNLNSAPARPQRNDLNIAKLGPLIGATITPVPAPQPDQRDDLQQVEGPENVTLDLSLKKPRELPPPAHGKHTYMYQERKSPAVYVSCLPPRQQSKLPSPKLANPKAGSITLGTPIVNQPRYEGLLRQMQPEPKMGSITQGTPIHVPTMDKRQMYDFYNKRPPNPPQPTYAYRQPSFEQMSSRQIILNDYITSQQMHGRRNEKPYYATGSPHRTPPPPQVQSQQRQGVIQRHTRPHYPPPPGHEALNSLVDVAVQQPSLPVPSAHEGLGKTMADNILEQPRRLQLMQQQQMQYRQLQQKMETEQRRLYQQSRQVPRSDSNTVTAASLIDAIITHQINQPAEGGRGEVVTNNREPQRVSDRLFQGFHREQPGQNEGNGEISPSIINVDLDGETNSKNLTVKELADSVISHDFGARGSNYYHPPDAEWKRRLNHKEEQKRSNTPQQDERQIIRIAQPQKYHVEPVSPPENMWSDQHFRRYQQPKSHISPLDYVKNRIVEVMRTEDDKKDQEEVKERSNSPGDMVIDEEKHPEEFQQQQSFNYSYVPQQQVKEGNNEPKPLLSAQYESLSDED